MLDTFVSNRNFKIKSLIEVIFPSNFSSSFIVWVNDVSFPGAGIKLLNSLWLMVYFTSYLFKSPILPDFKIYPEFKYLFSWLPLLNNLTFAWIFANDSFTWSLCSLFPSNCLSHKKVVVVLLNFMLNQVTLRCETSGVSPPPVKEIYYGDMTQTDDLA